MPVTQRYVYYLHRLISISHELAIQLRALADALTPTLAALRQQEYYTEPRFHASVGWALLGSPNPVDSPSKDFPTIPHFPVDLLNTLNDSFTTRLASKSTGTFDAIDVRVKIGKEVHKWTLG